MYILTYLPKATKAISEIGTFAPKNREPDLTNGNAIFSSKLEKGITCVENKSSKLNRFHIFCSLIK